MPSRLIEGSARVRATAATVTAVLLWVGAAMAQQPQPGQANPSAPKAQQRPPQGQQPAAPRAQPNQAQPAPQQAQPPAGPTVVSLKSSPEQPDWVKVCGEDQVLRKTVCSTTQNFVTENNQPAVAVAVSEVKDDPRRLVRLVLPLGFLLQPGIRVSIDKSQPIAARFQICVAQGCLVEMEAKEEQIVALKKSGQIKIDLQNPAAREVNLVVPMDGFGKSYDGAPIDPKILQEQARKLQEELARRAEDLRQRQSQGGTAPAPTAPPKQN